MKMEDLEIHVKNAFNKADKPEEKSVTEEQPVEKQEVKEASKQQLDLFGFPVEESGFDKKALSSCKVVKEGDGVDTEAPKKVSVPKSEESFSSKNTDEKGDKADTGDDIKVEAEDGVTGTGEGEEY